MTQVATLSIRQALTPTKGGKYRCPVCGKNNFEVGEGNSGKPLVKCWNGCEQDAVIAKLCERGLWSGAAPAENNLNEDERALRAQKARAILRAARKHDLPPDAYLEGRGIEEVPENAYLLPAKEARRLKLSHPNYPRLVVPVVDREGREVGCHTVLLTRDEAKKLRLKDSSRPVKLSYGLIRGNFIEVGKAAPDRPLLVSEGYETALTVSQIAEEAAVATGGAEFHKAVELPPCSEVIVCADNDPPGRQAARDLAERLPIPTRIAVLEGPDGFDFNDALSDGVSVDELKKAILDAPYHEKRTGLVAVPMTKIIERPVRWFWQGVIPSGALTSIYGSGDVGKSTLLIDIMARTSRGDPFPMCDVGERGSVIILTKEDALDTIVKPRLKVAGADMSKVFTIGTRLEEDDEDDLPIVMDRLDENITEIERIICELADVRLIVIDAWSSFVGKLDSYRDTDIRKLLEPLARLAARHDIAIIGVLHLNKKADLPVTQRAIGGVGFINVPRAAFLVTRDPDDPERRIMVQTANRLTGHRHQALAFTMEEVRSAKANGVDFARVIWDEVEGFFVADPDELLSRKDNKDGSKLAQAAALLEELLADDPMPRKEIVARAKARGISFETLKRAKKRLPIAYYKEGGTYFWYMRVKSRL